jgi:hypothetical protein
LTKTAPALEPSVSGSRAELTLLMLVTPPDAPIARYAIRALLRSIAALPEIAVVVYLNGLSKEEENDFRCLVAGWEPQVTTMSNRAHLASLGHIRVGEWYTAASGVRALREGPYENGSEVWSRELVALNSPYVGIIDGDFEVFHPGLILTALRTLREQPAVGFFSSDYSETRVIFDSFSNRQAKLMERWHTWFCVYRRACLREYHDFSYVEIQDSEGGLPLKMDHSARLQQELIARGWRGHSYNSSYAWQYLHYGAFAKNADLRGLRLTVYRFCMILKHNGYRHVHGTAVLAKVLQRIGRVAWSALRLSRYDAARRTYIFQRAPVVEGH